MALRHASGPLSLFAGTFHLPGLVRIAKRHPVPQQPAVCLSLQSVWTKPQSLLTAVKNLPLEGNAAPHFMEGGVTGALCNHQWQ